ncbi:MAG: hypothetical protein JSV44_07750, partial [Candidatus Zixiibacteriota bacterium]
EPDYMDSLCTFLEVSSRDAYRRVLDEIRDRLEIKTLAIWDLWAGTPAVPPLCDSLLGSENQFDLLNKTMSSIGFDLANLPIYYFFKESPGVSGQVQVHVIHYPDDIRVLANPGNGYVAMENMIRSGGLAVYAVSVDQEEYLFRHSPADCWSEAMADVYSLVIKEKLWQQEYLKMPEDLATRWQDYFMQIAVVNLRFLLMQTMFERDLYLRTNRDPNELYEELFEKIMEIPSGDNAQVWAASEDNVGRGIYAHNRLLGELIAAQIYHYLKKNNENVVDNPATKYFLVQNCYRFGRRHDWRHILEWATGEELIADYYLNQITLLQTP